MLRPYQWIVFTLFGVLASVPAAERVFDLTQYPLNETPKGFRSLISGEGKPGDWKIILDEMPSLMSAFSEKAPIMTKRPVIAQLATDHTDEHFPLLVYDEESYGDFTLTTRFKTVNGTVEQMAGLAFRIQDEKNYYYIRASSLGNTMRFYKFVNGQRSQEPIGSNVAIPKGVWHELTIECKGNYIRCWLNGKEAFPTITDYSFTSGKIGFWTKSDSVSYFTDTRIQYTPRESLAKVLLREQLKRYPRLVGLRIYSTTEQKPAVQVIASNKPDEIGLPGSSVEYDVISNNRIYAGKGARTYTVTLPLHDRNGEVVAAVRVVLQSFRGQTDENAVARALPVVKEMESRIRSKQDLTQ